MAKPTEDRVPTPTRNPALFPASVAQHTVLFDEAATGELADSFPGVALPASLSSAVRKRQVEYAAGRYCAREALRICAPALADAPVGTGASREPLWPTGIVGAITHTRGYASVAVAQTGDIRAIGLDAERWMEPSLATQLAHQIAAQDEISALARATGFSFSQALTVIFSAKESVFKCLFPEVRRYFDFRDAAIVWADARTGSFDAKLLVTLTPSLCQGRVFGGRFETDDGLVCTAMVIPAS